jgi:hypothetical protein
MDFGVVPQFEFSALRFLYGPRFVGICCVSAYSIRP